MTTDADLRQELNHINKCRYAQRKQVRACLSQQPASTRFPVCSDHSCLLNPHGWTLLCKMDFELLISKVYARQPVWDKWNKHHAYRNVVDRLWAEISQE